MLHTFRFQAAVNKVSILRGSPANLKMLFPY